MIRIPFLTLPLLMAAMGAAALEAGAAKAEITSTPGAPLGGRFENRWGRESIARQDPIWARCLYLADDSTRLFLVNVDLWAISPGLRTRVLELMPNDSPGASLILTATGTTNGPGGMHQDLMHRFWAGRFMPDDLEAAARSIAKVMSDALTGKRRAAIGISTFIQNDLSINTVQPGGPVDQQVTVMQVEDPDGNAIAIMACFACAPSTVSGADSQTISADFPGYFYDEIERLSTPGCVAIFLNGCFAGQEAAPSPGKEGWKRTEWLGRLLAERVMSATNAMTLSEEPLHFSESTPTPPLPLAAPHPPGTTPLQTVEIGAALLTFIPGRPTVETGAELRRRALERGYTSQTSIALANGDIGCIPIREQYPLTTYPLAFTFHGPNVADWLCVEISRLMTLGTPESQRGGLDTPPSLSPDEEGLPVLRVSGTAYQVGNAQGAVFGAALSKRFQDSVARPCAEGKLTPGDGWWAWAPSFLDVSPLALTRLAWQGRPMLAGLSVGTRDTLEGLADGATLPFDTAWLTQISPISSGGDNLDTLYGAPFHSMMAATGAKAGSAGLLIGRNLDWPGVDECFISDAISADGHRILHLGLPWSAGVWTGLNDAGIVLCVERSSWTGEMPLTGPPIEILARDILGTTADFDTALEILRKANHIRGFRVLVAGYGAPLPSLDAPGATPTRPARKTPARPDDSNAPPPPKPTAPRAAIVIYGEQITVHDETGGLALGNGDTLEETDMINAERQARFATLAAARPELDVTAMKETLTDKAIAGGRKGKGVQPAHVFAVIEPRALTLHYARRDADGSIKPWRSISMKGDAP